MPVFEYLLINKKKETVSSTIEAADKLSAINTLKSRGQLIKIEEKSAKKSAGFSFGKKKKGAKTDELVMFTRQLSAMVSAGVPILRSLNSMAKHAESAGFRETINAVIKDIEGGMSFADALGKHPETFNDIYVNMVAAGETGGILDDILKRLALQQEKNSSMKKKIKGAMTYPIVLLAITIIAFFILMTFIIPVIGKTIKDMGGPDAKLPLLTEIMLGISDFMVSFWYLIVPAFIGGIWALIRYIKTPKGRVKFHHIIIKVPAVGAIVRKVAIARFTRTFSALIGAGVAVLEALDVTSRAVGNVVYEESLKEATKRVQNGEVLSRIIAERDDLYPPIVAQMLSVGEETGQTDKVLIKVADFYEEEVDTAIDGVSSIIEPVMIVAMGGVIALVAVSVMGPITSMAGQVKG
ncbi:secretion system protein [Candidatus Nanosynbacter lyticus]|jgi:type IV pilus assembly protein PilC|uniref:Secretion system protein n=1 Tax=Candidatus Nanosynbacter lyticus TaxID=2093824 RepID=A0A6S4GTH0_9BACT|nr:type II secretion system F family protein [Candidatus Nanosynbacter lyticus]AJA06604.1 secretion system protein [Candidatus Nanosynbacter lyticus]QCT41733.1 type II secretion system F family protein [TM7 phylum sp. oral taxon 952]